MAAVCRLFVMQFEPRLVQPPSLWRLALAAFIVGAEWFLLRSVFSIGACLAMVLLPMWTEYSHWSVWVDSARELRWKVLNREPLKATDYSTWARLVAILEEEPEYRRLEWSWWRGLCHLNLEAVADASNVKSL